MTESATVQRQSDGTVVVKRTGATFLHDANNVECVNPDAHEAHRVYQKVFRTKPVYLPDERELALSTHLRGENVLVIAMNGYSTIKPEQCAAWGVKPGAYEKACEVFLESVTVRQRREFPDIDVRYAHGASDLGVDRSTQRVGKKLRRRQLGFSCPDYLFYCNDDDIPVYVAEDVQRYSDAFVQSSDILIAANGRLQSYRMDIAAVFENDKFLIPVNILRLISTTGGPPAKTADGKIEDAVAHYEQRVRIAGHGLRHDDAGDPWSQTIRQVGDFVTSMSRQILPFEIGLEVPHD